VNAEKQDVQNGSLWR